MGTVAEISRLFAEDRILGVYEVRGARASRENTDVAANRGGRTLSRAALFRLRSRCFRSPSGARPRAPSIPLPSPPPPTAATIAAGSASSARSRGPLRCDRAAPSCPPPSRARPASPRAVLRLFPFFLRAAQTDLASLAGSLRQVSKLEVKSGRCVVGTQRLLCLTTPKAGGRGQGSIRILKRTSKNAPLSESKKLKLKHLESLRVLDAQRDGATGVIVHFSRSGGWGGGSAHGAFGFSSVQSLAQFVAIVEAFCSVSEGRAVPIQNITPQVERAIKALTAGEGGGGDDGGGGGSGGGGGGAAPSPKGRPAPEGPASPARPPVAARPPAPSASVPSPRPSERPAGLPPGAPRSKTPTPSPDPAGAPSSASGKGPSPLRPPVPSTATPPPEPQSPTPLHFNSVAPTATPPRSMQHGSSGASTPRMSTEPSSPMSMLQTPGRSESPLSSSRSGAGGGVDLFDVLELISGAGASVDEVRERLEAELEALEASIVHELLELPEDGGVVAVLADEALGALGEAESALAVAEARLSAFKDDAERLEHRAGLIENRVRAVRSLGVTLRSLFDALELPAGVEDALRSRSSPAGRVRELAVAASIALRTISSLNGAKDAATGGDRARDDARAGGLGGLPGATVARLPPELADMTAVRVRREELQRQLDASMGRAAAWLEEELGRWAQTVAPSGPNSRRASSLALSRSRYREAARSLGPLLCAVVRSRPQLADVLVRAYAVPMAAMLKREALTRVETAAGEIGVAQNLGGPGYVSRAASLDVPARAPRRPAAAPTAEDGSVSGPAEAATSPGVSPLVSTYPRVLMDVVGAMMDESREAWDVFRGETDGPLALPESVLGAQALSASAMASDESVRGVGQALAAAVGEHLPAIQGLSALPMLAETALARARLPPGAQPGDPGRRAAESAIDACTKRLEASAVAGAAEWAAAVRRDEQRLASAAGVEHTHFLPCFDSSLALVGDVEAEFGRSLTQLVRAEGAAQGGGSGGASGASAALQRPASPRGDRGLSRPPRPDDGSHLVSYAMARPPSSGARSATLRTMADDLYRAVLRASLAALEKLATRDSSSGKRLRLELYSNMRDSLAGAASSRVPPAPLADLRRTVSERYESAMAAYVEALLKDFGFDAFVDLVRRLEDLELREARTGIHQDPPMSLQNLISVLGAAREQLGPRLVATSRRLRSQLGESSPKLKQMVWRKVQDNCISLWQKLVALLPKYYPGFDPKLRIELLQSYLDLATSAAAR